MWAAGHNFCVMCCLPSPLDGDAAGHGIRRAKFPSSWKSRRTHSGCWTLPCITCVTAWMALRCGPRPRKSRSVWQLLCWIFYVYRWVRHWKQLQPLSKWMCLLQSLYEHDIQVGFVSRSCLVMPAQSAPHVVSRNSFPALIVSLLFSPSDLFMGIIVVDSCDTIAKEIHN